MGYTAATVIFALNKYKNKEITPVESIHACTMVFGMWFKGLICRKYGTIPICPAGGVRWTMLQVIIAPLKAITSTLWCRAKLKGARWAVTVNLMVSYTVWYSIWSQQWLEKIISRNIIYVHTRCFVWICSTTIACSYQMRMLIRVTVDCFIKWGLSNEPQEIWF